MRRWGRLERAGSSRGGASGAENERRVNRQEQRGQRVPLTQRKGSTRNGQIHFPESILLLEFSQRVLQSHHSSYHTCSGDPKNSGPPSATWCSCTRQQELTGCQPLGCPEEPCTGEGERPQWARSRRCYATQESKGRFSGRTVGRAGRDVPLPKAGSQIPLEHLTQGDSTDVPSHRLN